MTTGHLYIAPYHVAGDKYVCRATGQAEPGFAAYLDAVKAQRWPYDTGDDPGFYCFRLFGCRGGTLSWGICRPPVRNAIQPNDVVAFFGLYAHDDQVEYRFSGYATVWRKVRQTSIWRDAGLAVYRRYLNLLVRPESDGFRWHESNPNEREWHPDWPRRIVKRSGAWRAECDEIQKTGFLPADLADRVAENYVLFRPEVPLTYILAEPCPVARYEKAWGPREEKWLKNDPADAIRALTIERTKDTSHPRHLRTANVQRSHPHIKIPLDVVDWCREAYRALARYAACRPFPVEDPPQDCSA